MADYRTLNLSNVRMKSRPAAASSETAGNPTYTGPTTYEDFTRQAQAAGLYDSFSQQDLQLAQKNPAAGMSILSAKQQWQNAQTPEAKALANKRAEAIRSSYGGYTGGTSGSYYNLNPLSPISFEQQDKYGDRIEALLTAMENREPFQFEYNYQTDPEYQAYRKAALREGQRATQDTMGQAAAMTGGRPSSYAVSAAGQQGNYYAAQIADKIPELAQQAYNRAYQQYMDEFSQKMQTAGLMQSQQQADYNRLTDEVQNQRLLRDEESQARQEQWEKAWKAYEVGDDSQLKALGIDTSRDISRQMQELQVRQQEQQMQTQEWQDQLAKAQAAAQYGDYSLLEALGFDTSRADFDRDLTIAQLIASYTGDTSALSALLRENGYTVPTAASSGYSGGYSSGYSGSSGSGYSGSSGSGSTGTTTKKTDAEIAAIRAQKAGNSSTADYPNAYGTTTQSTAGRSGRFNRGR